MYLLKPALSVLLFALGVVSQSTDLTSCSDCEIINRDVAIIGGGSTGTYTAVRLRDQNYSVAVIERQGYLGGHAETYTAPNNWTIDIGVIVFGNSSAVRNYFSRFNVSLLSLGGGTGANLPSSAYDYRTGQPVTNFISVNSTEYFTALDNYAQQLAKYPALNLSFNLTYPVAADSDLLMPFGQFARKYNMTAALYKLFVTNQGYAPLLDIPTIYMFKYLNAGQLSSEKNGYLTTLNHNIGQLYQNAQAFLGTSNVYLNSTVLAVDRTQPNLTRVLFQTPSGCKLLVARKLVITIPPLLNSFQNISLTPTETNLFAEFFANGYYTGVLTNTSLPSNFRASSGSSDTENFNIPTLPGIYSLSANPGAPGYFQVYYGSPTPLPSSYVKADILAAISRLQVSLNVTQTTPQWAAFKSHAPFNLMVTPAAIQDRFYEKVSALQGMNGTWWNGAAWDAQDSSALWDFTDQVLIPRIVGSLKAGG